ncbi:uncharacterized protein [Euwallacea fornicatus]|uniref:uncharacterized protein n=1 Tax=Euwallacea fornicatus TaxID=995702 RepID=UPI00338D8EFE
MACGKKWREADTIKFVELYEKAECLWNFRHPVYKHRNARDKAIQNMLKEMNMADFGVNELKNKIKNIRSTYQQEVNKIRRSKENLGGGIMEEYKTNLAWFHIADRFLRGVINSTYRSPAAKIEEEAEDTTLFQQDQANLYNMVETEMAITNGETESDLLTFPGNRQIKEEIVKDEYDSPIHHEVKRRRLSTHHQHVGYEITNGLDPSTRSEDILERVYQKSPAMESYTATKDEWYHFSNNIACQLRTLPLERALMCQKKIVDILTEERIDYLLTKNGELKPDG